MKTTLPLILGLSCALTAPLHAEELAPPNVDFYGEFQVNRNDLGNLGVDQADGLSVRAGMWLNDLGGPWGSRFGLEAGLIRLGEDNADSSYTRSPTASEAGVNGADVVQINDRLNVKVNGLGFGGIWDSGHWLYLRGGAYLYDYKATERSQRVLIDNGGNPSVTYNDTPASDDTNTLAPYLGAGFAVRLTGPLVLVADYTSYRVESEQVGSVSLGLRYDGK
ncbi:hypothetical protein A11A3_06036 [Alcanivorax hongdengensis A-11-3]|uniref:Uncharacterized protein n=1 Tax=Alcanivorax hongdengensis A-11-3 TaxID=1177179 RepID=L0WGP9_9GAMM|nr:outer membrane beta-barrel protein [Alcanivorax hongdengensis]EKF74990.1 hypothetical protein A11A3_06036 [Alcanivorax hongdengensis A-11-3]